MKGVAVGGAAELDWGWHGNRNPIAHQHILYILRLKTDI